MTIDFNQPIPYRTHPKEIQDMIDEERVRAQYVHRGRRSTITGKERRKRTKSHKTARRSRARNR